MSNIVRLEAGRGAGIKERRDESKDAPAEIVIFPGVRYERTASTPEPDEGHPGHTSGPGRKPSRRTGR